MRIGSIVEYIDQQKIVCGVVLEIKNHRLRLITENNREVSLSMKRLSHSDQVVLDLSTGRDRLVAHLKGIVNRRNSLVEEIDIQELWEVLNSEQEWIDLITMTEICFPNHANGDHQSAVVRAFFWNRGFFKFDHHRFFPFSEAKVEQIRTQAEEAERRARTIEAGKSWLRRVLSDGPLKNIDLDDSLIGQLKSYYLYEKESPDYPTIHEILRKAEIRSPETIFQILVKLKVWKIDENLDLIRQKIPMEFSPKVNQSASGILTQNHVARLDTRRRRDLTDIPLLTIDGQATLDLDDALSFEDKGDHYLVGIHIADVGEFIAKKSTLDQEARNRGSSIYMPDQRIPMLPSDLSEDLCSLRVGESRPAISTLVKIKKSGKIIDYEVFPSIVRVRDRLTYQDANMSINDRFELEGLYNIAKTFRQKRLSQGAIQITLPEINVWMDPDGALTVTRTNRESPARMLVAELMIMANWLTASFLNEGRIPAVFRSQPGPRERLYDASGGTLFQNWMQRKSLSRFILSPEAEHHNGLGLDVYVTATSPIRKYFDLVTQRQVRAAFDLEKPYSKEEIEEIIADLYEITSSVGRIQNRRNRYWLLKYLEGRIKQKEEAVILNKRRNGYQTLIPAYMIECSLPAPGGMNLKPQDLVHVTIQHVDARKNVFNVFMM